MLAVARTVTSAGRLLDVLPLVAEDARVQVVFTVDSGSAFGHGVTDWLRRLGVPVIPWPRATATAFDLALSASDHGELHRIKAPLVLLPHGAGYNKYVVRPAGPESAREISGFAPSGLLWRGHVVPSAIVLSHPSQLRQLQQECPEAAPTAVVAGDPCLDRMLASRRRRAAYRRVFGAAERTLVVLSSTWGGASLIGRYPDLPARLLGELPADEYAVAAVLHPNVWARHGRWQIRRWLRTACDAGLLLIPPEEGWRASLIAADAVIADHGSLACYAAAMDVPLMLTPQPTDEVVAGSPMTALGRLAPRLEPSARLRPQLDAAITAHRRNRYAAVTSEVFAKPGESARLLRGVLYPLMDLTPPPSPPALGPLPLPEHVDLRRPTAFAVEGEATVAAGAAAVAVLQRFPAVLDRTTVSEAARHLAVYEAEPDERLLQSAAVLVCGESREPQAGRNAETGATALLRRYPGCRMAAEVEADGMIRVVLGGGGTIGVRPLDRRVPIDAAVWASALHLCLLAGASLPDLRFLTVRLGGVAATASVRATAGA